MSYLIDTMTKIPARFFTNTNGRRIRVVVVHDMEAPETNHTAEDVAHWWNGPDSAQSSAHVSADSDSAVRSVDDDDVAWHAPGCNSDGLGIEHAGYISQTRQQWTDTFDAAMFKISAQVVAEWCVRYNIPPRHLSDAELQAGEKGIVGHDQVTRVYGLSTHTDPGQNFPWDVYMAAVQEEYNKLVTPAPAPTPTPTPKPAADAKVVELQKAVHQAPDGLWGVHTDCALRTLRHGPKRPFNVKYLQEIVGTPADGIWGPHSQAAFLAAVKAVQTALGVAADGAWGPKTDAAFYAMRNLQYKH